MLYQHIYKRRLACMTPWLLRRKHTVSSSSSVGVGAYEVFDPSAVINIFMNLWNSEGDRLWRAIPKERKEAQVSDTGRANRLSEHRGRVENNSTGSRDLFSVGVGLWNFYKCCSFSLQVKEIPIIRTQLGDDMAELIKE
jgi:hypothetical protein